jgi:hypothetical protein
MRTSELVEIRRPFVGQLWCASVLNLVPIVAIIASVSTSEHTAFQELREAQIALVFLRAGLGPTATRLDRYVILPSSEPLTYDEAVVALTRIPKPVRCLMEALPHALEIVCVAPNTFELREIHRIARTHFVDGLLHDFETLGVSHTNRTKILIEGSQDQLVVTIADLQGFASAYEIPHAIGVDRASPDQESLGIAMVWHLSPANGWSFETPIGTIRPHPHEE